LAQSVEWPGNWTSIFDRGREGIFSLHHLVQTGSWAHPGSCKVGTGDSIRW